MLGQEQKRRSVSLEDGEPLGIRAEGRRESVSFRAIGAAQACEVDRKGSGASQKTAGNTLTIKLNTM